MPPFFRQHAPSLALAKAREDAPGLRRAQLGATHAVCAHFTLSREPALVSMPTGTGKTAVLMMAPFFTEARRALVITPSRMVRDQIVEEFSALALLKRLGVLPDAVPAPVVLGIESKILHAEQWDVLVGADVVVTTPMGSSPALEDVPHPPADLFDLLLVDEAHHSPARTWTGLIQSFPESRQVLFTATPFRRDRRLLPGRFVYEFPLREALRDGAFGSIRFIGCEPDPDVPNDVTIALRAEQEYRADRTAGFDHRLMVRTDSRPRAAELKALYEQHTSLKLSIIHGQHSLRHVRRTVRELREGTIDGVVCVDMFGEGVDMPQLKIAAIHAPHRSLAVTLQFIGRFARTGGERLGEAKFVAVPDEIEAETKALYRQGAVWEQLVTNLADSRVARERQLAEQLHSFSADGSAASDADLTLAVIKPWYHCKVFHITDAVDLHASLEIPGDCQIIQHFVSDDLHCAVYVGRAARKPRWLESPAVQDVGYHLFIIHHDRSRNLLFINSSIKNEDLYSLIAEQLLEGPFRGLTTAHINRALRALEHPSFFSVGLKNRLFGNQVESYRIISGGKADGAVSHTDAQLFDRGHLFGSGETEGAQATLGISTLSKVWSNRAGFVPEFVSWCSAIAEHLMNSAPVVTGSRIDLLCTGEEIAALPAPVIGATWHETAYKTRPTLFLEQSPDRQHDILSLDLEITHCTPTSVTLTLAGIDVPIEIAYRLDAACHFAVTSQRDNPMIRVRTYEGALEQYLNSYGIHLYLADFSRVHANQLFRSNLTATELPSDAIVMPDWAGLRVDITCEYGTNGRGPSVHDGLSELLCGSAASVVVYDHRSGEVADFVTLTDGYESILCEVFHCKKSGGDAPGSRVGDAYEVVGQIVKSVQWSRSPSALKTQLTRRLATGSSLLKGTLVDLERILDEAGSTRFEFHVRLVQPGLSAAALSEEVTRVLSSGYDYVRLTTGIAPQMWISS